MIEIIKKKLRLRNIPAKLKIAQFSDIHIHKNSIKLLEACEEKINALKADLIIFTGDSICNGTRHHQELMNCLKKMEARLGKYYCFGNHDYSDGHEGQKIREVFKKSDFIELSNSSETITRNWQQFSIAGLDDLELGDQNIEKTANNIKTDGSIWITHNPINFEKISEHSPSLVMAGHTHGVQIRIPYSNYIYKKYLNSKYLSGLYCHNNSLLYVNKGLGRSVLDFKIFNSKLSIPTPRIGSNPEITFIETQ